MSSVKEVMVFTPRDPIADMVCLYGCLPGSKSNSCRVAKKSAASVGAASILTHQWPKVGQFSVGGNSESLKLRKRLVDEIK